MCCECENMKENHIFEKSRNISLLFKCFLNVKSFKDIYIYIYIKTKLLKRIGEIFAILSKLRNDMVFYFIYF